MIFNVDYLAFVALLCSMHDWAVRTCLSPNDQTETKNVAALLLYGQSEHGQYGAIPTNTRCIITYARPKTMCSHREGCTCEPLVSSTAVTLCASQQNTYILHERSKITPKVHARSNKVSCAACRNMSRRYPLSSSWSLSSTRYQLHCISKRNTSHLLQGARAAKP